MSNTQKLLIITGVILISAGFLWPWISKIPFGKLPGDIVIDKPNFKMFIPITSMIILSLVISLVVWIVRKS